MNEVEAAVPKGIESPILLIGEGVEEVLFLEALLSELNVAGVQVEHYEGKSGLGRYLQAIKNRPGFADIKKLGIIRDADDDPPAAVRSVDGAIAQAAFEPNLTVTRMIIPSATEKGALENLCLRTLAGKPIEPCIEEFLSCATRATTIQHTSTAAKAKARIHAWLSAQREPDLRLGHAAKKGLIDWSSPVFAELKEFLRELHG
jgi:hypothetical protein